MPSLTPDETVQHLINGNHHDPFQVLGLHPSNDGVVVRALLPGAETVSVVPSPPARGVHPMVRRHPVGFFEARLADLEFPYRLEIIYPDNTLRALDPYAFPPFLSDFDLHLFCEGQDLRLHEKLGAHRRRHCGVEGVGFAVWAPNANRVSVVGNFNGWNGIAHPMRARGASGVWELFLPEMAEGEYYKFEIASESGGILLKSDPFAVRMEHRPRTASVAHTMTGLFLDRRRLVRSTDCWRSPERARFHLRSTPGLLEAGIRRRQPAADVPGTRRPTRRLRRRHGVHPC